MRQVTIHDRPQFAVISHGNGLAYTFHHKPSNREVFLQGDDAATFRDEIKRYENAGWDYDRMFAELWHGYSDIATPCSD